MNNATQLTKIFISLFFLNTFNLHAMEREQQPPIDIGVQPPMQREGVYSVKNGTDQISHIVILPVEIHRKILKYVIDSSVATETTSKAEEAAKTIRAWARVNKNCYTTVNSEACAKSLANSLGWTDIERKANECVALRTRRAAIWLSMQKYGVLSYWYEADRQFISACEAGDKESVSFMLFAHPSLISAIDYKQHHATGLMRAAYSGHLEIVNKLLDAGAQVNVQSLNMQMTALMYAFQRECALGKDNSAVIKRLLAAGADVSLKDNREHDVFYYARKNHPLEQQLLAHYEMQKKQLVQNQQEVANASQQTSSSGFCAIQ